MKYYLNLISILDMADKSCIHVQQVRTSTPLQDSDHSTMNALNFFF